MDDVEYLNKLIQQYDEFYDDLEALLKFVKCWRCGQAIIKRQRNTCLGCGPITVLMFDRDRLLVVK